MSCNITAGIAKTCNQGLGGVKEVWLGNGPTVLTWYVYELPKQTASITETYQITPTGSILGFQQQLTISLLKMEADKQEQIKRIAESNNMRCVVILNDGTRFEIGTERGAYLAQGTTNTGISYGDFNGTQLVIHSDSKEPMQPFKGELFLDVELTRVEELGICNFYPTPAPNGYLQFNQVNVDTYSAWNQYQCDEIWGGQGAPLDTTKDIYLEGSFTIRVDSGTTQQEWDDVRNNFLGVNTSNTGNFPPAPPEPVFFQLTTFLPATLPQVGYTQKIVFGKNIGKLNIGSSPTNQMFGIMMGNSLANRPPVTGPWTPNIKQIAGELKAYIG